MNALRRGAQASVRQSRSTLRQHQRRLESSTAHNASSGHSASSGKVKTTESLSLGFYFGVACIPGVFLIHNLATAKDPWLTQVIARYANFKDEWFRRNELHGSAIQQAAADKNLFVNSRGSDYIDLRNSETFNHGSPYNVAPGAYINLDKVIGHYQKLNKEEQEKRDKAVREGTAGKQSFDPRMKNVSNNPTAP